ncbi:hypothetical protein EJB05_46309, partial [Eragrostis curvula]
MQVIALPVTVNRGCCCTDIMSSHPDKSLPNRRRTRSHAVLGSSSSASTHSEGATSALLGGASMTCPDDFPTEFQAPSRRSVRRRLFSHPAEPPHLHSTCAAHPCQKRKASSEPGDSQKDIAPMQLNACVSQRPVRRRVIPSRS